MDITSGGQPVPGPGLVPPDVPSTGRYNLSSYTNTVKFRSTIVFLSDTLPRNVYLYLLLTMPLLYASRVREIFKGVQQSQPEVQLQERVRTVIMVNGEMRMTPEPTMSDWAPNSLAVNRLINSWDFFVDSLVKEWKTLNIVSVLLSAAILTTLQIEGAATDPYTRYFALLALVCSLTSILYGCIYIIRFNTLRRSRKIIGWSKRAQKTDTSIWWNIRILLALPVIWFSWSFLFYLVCVMTFVWRTGTTSDAVLQLTPLAALGPRIVITLALVLGLIYLCLVIIEFRHYGKAEVDEWNNTVQGQYDQQLFDPTSAGPVGSGGGGYITPQHGSGRRNSLFPGAAQARADTLSPPTTASAWLPAAPLTPSYRAASPVPYVPNDLNLTLAQSHSEFLSVSGGISASGGYDGAGLDQPVSSIPLFSMVEVAPDGTIHREGSSDAGLER